MCTISKFSISGCQIIYCKHLKIDVTLPASKYLLVKGVVYSPDGEPLPHAAVEVLQIDKTIYPPIEKRMGATFTIEDGSYGISLPRSSGYEYKLVAYSSIYCKK